MAQTFGDFVKECELFEYSQDYYDLLKESFEISLMEKWIENQRFMEQTLPYIEEAGYEIDSDFFMEQVYLEEGESEEKKEAEKGFGTKVKDHWNDAKDKVEKGWNDTKEKASGYYDAFTAKVKKYYERAKELFSKLINMIITFFRKLVNMLDPYNRYVRDIINVIKKTPEKMNFSEFRSKINRNDYITLLSEPKNQDSNGPSYGYYDTNTYYDQPASSDLKDLKLPRDLENILAFLLSTSYVVLNPYYGGSAAIDIDKLFILCRISATWLTNWKSVPFFGMDRIDKEIEDSKKSGLKVPATTRGLEKTINKFEDIKKKLEEKFNKKIESFTKDNKGEDAKKCTEVLNKLKGVIASTIKIMTTYATLRKQGIEALAVACDVKIDSKHTEKYGFGPKKEVKTESYDYDDYDDDYDFYD